MTRFGPSDLVVRGRSARMLGRVMPCAVGRGGIGIKRGEGDGVTPLGRFAVVAWMGRADRLFCDGFEAFGTSAVWSDDPSDERYNARRLWRDGRYSAERLARADGLYDLVGVLDFNLAAPVRGAGSAIFLHVWRGPGRATEGCIAFDLKDLQWIRARWRPWSRVVVRV